MAYSQEMALKTSMIFVLLLLSPIVNAADVVDLNGTWKSTVGKFIYTLRIDAVTKDMSVRYDVAGSNSIAAGKFSLKGNSLVLTIPPKGSVKEEKRNYTVSSTSVNTLTLIWDNPKLPITFKRSKVNSK